MRRRVFLRKVVVRSKTKISSKNKPKVLYSKIFLKVIKIKLCDSRWSRKIFLKGVRCKGLTVVIFTEEANLKRSIYFDSYCWISERPLKFKGVAI